MLSHRRLRILSAMLPGLFALIGLWLLLGLAGGIHLVSANPGTLYVATTGIDNNLCSSSQPCRTLQHAVDLALSGDTIKVAAGQYTTVTARFNPYEGEIVTQVVYISKTVTIRGGYTSTFSEPPDPQANTVIFDAQRQGRVFHIYGDWNISPTLEGLHITGGKILTTLNSGFGGGVYVDGAQLKISSCQIYDNRADFGGGLWLGPGSSIANNELTLNNSSIYSNTAIYGGGIDVGWSKNVRISGNTIYSNTVSLFGGGIIMGDISGVQLENNTIISNSAGYGGGLYLSSSTGQINYNNITANSGGGLYLAQTAVNLTGNAIVSNTTFQDGGGVYLNDSRGDILTSNTITGNTADKGGGVYVSGGTVTLNGNQVRSNAAKWDGGAFYLTSDVLTSGNTVTMTNMVIADNQTANGESSSLYIAGMTATLLHTTLARNAGSSGRGLYLTDWGVPPVYSTVTLTNSIIVSQAVGVFVDTGSTAHLDSTLWNDNITNTLGPGTIVTGTHNYTGSPNFALDGYHILTGSAAIDKGVSTSLNSDIDPEPRPYLAPDLGADEYWAPGALHKVYLPLTLKTP